jgi:hypothetical protein
LSGLGGGVVNEAANGAAPGGDRTVGDDAAGAPFAHPEHGRLRTQERAGEVGIDNLVPAFQRGVEDILAVHDAGVVHQDVDAAELAVERGEHRFHLFFAADVGLKKETLRAGGAQPGQRTFAVGSADNVVHGHGGAARRGERRCDSGADAPGGAGHQRDLTVQPEHRTISARGSRGRRPADGCR